MGKDLDLLNAVKNNDVGTVRKILSKVWSAKSKKAAKKFNINIQDEDGFTSLHHAALKGNTDITMALLDVQCNVNARDKKGMAPLHLASWAGKTEITKLLVDARACVNICADSGETPLHLACQHCNIGVVEVLLDSNVDSTVVNKNGESALDLACRFGHVQVVEMLLKSKDCKKLLSLYEQNPKTADPPLHIACKTGREEIVMMLLDHGADINQKGANGTPLHEASLYGKTDVVKILLDSGADVNITNDEGRIPLDLVLQFTSSRASQEIKGLLRDASKTKVVTAKAIHDYQNIYDPTCLAFKTGDIIEVLEQNESGRWKGKVTCGKRELVGYFPSTMVKIMNPRRSVVSGKTMSMKNAGILPVGKYEMVALPSASGQSSPVHGRPRLSSFQQNGRSTPSPPVSPEKDLPPPDVQKPTPAKRNRPNLLTNGLEESKLFNKTKESLQYVEVSVDNKSPSPTSPGSSSGQRTQYAEVVLQDEEAPLLPQKSYKQENENEKRIENGSDIWVKNSSDHPELPVKCSSVSNGKTTVDAELENRMKDENENENENGMEDEMKEENESENEEDLLLSHNASSELEKAIQSLDANRPITPEKPRKNYEDMSLDSPDRESLPERKVQKDAQFSPRKLDFDGREPRGSPSTERRQILAYENVELNKHRPKDAVVTTMLISDIDQEMDPDYVVVNKGVSPVLKDIAPNKKHSYENVPKGFESSEGTEKEGAPQNFEKMGAVGNENTNYEDMAGVGVIEKKLSNDFETTPGYVLMQAEKKTLSQTESYENIDIRPEEGSAGSSGSAEYMTMKDGVYIGPNRDYINIQLPAAPDSAHYALPDAPSGLTMSDYNSLYDWLESCKLVVYIDNFVQGGFDMSCMAGLTAEDLTAINVIKTGHRKKLLSESSKLESEDFPHERPEDIMTWLRLIHLDQYIPQFIDNGFDDMEFVQDITIEDIISIGITKPGHQRKIWMAVKALGLAGPDENREVSQNSITDTGKAEGYLETDLDMVEQERMKEREGMEVLSTDIDSALSRLPADGSSDVAVAFEDTSTKHEHCDEPSNETSTKTLDREMASLQIDSLNDTRGSTPNLDSILDSLDKDSTGSSQEGKKETPPSLPTEKRSSGPFHMSFSRRSRSSSKDRMSEASGASSRNSLENQLEISSEVNDADKNTKLPSTTAEVDFGRNVDDVRQDNSTTSEESEVTRSRPRHNSMYSKSVVTTSESSSFDQRMRGTSFDSKTTKKRPPPPVKPKTPKKPPPIAPKPAGSPAKAVMKKESSLVKESGTTDTPNTERRFHDSAVSSPKKTPPPTLPKTRQGSVRSCSSTSSDDSIETVLEDLEKRKHYDDRRKSFEKLKRRFTDPSSDNSGYEDGSSDFRTSCESHPGLQEQIKDVFRRRSQENILVDQDQLKPPSQDTTATTTTTTTTIITQKDDVDTDEELLKDQQYTEALMKDINSMLSDFSTEIETMFDDQTDNSTSV